MKTGVPVRARATSSGASARDREAPWGPGVRAAAAARAGRGAFRWEAKRERWCWRKDAAAASGFGGGDAAEGKGVGSDMGAAARGREGRVEMESGGAIAWVAAVRGASVVAWRARRLVGRRRRRRREAPGAGPIRLSLSRPSGAGVAGYGPVRWVGIGRFLVRFGPPSTGSSS